VFGIDVKLPGLLTARVVRCPVFGGKVTSFNADKAKAVAGVRHVVQISTGVAVVADNYWSASRGAQALEIKWDEGQLASLTSAAILQRYKTLAQQPGKVARNDGNADAALESARGAGPSGTAGSRSFERAYEAPFLAHATMEPMNCTAESVRWVRCVRPTQGGPPRIRPVAASGYRRTARYTPPTWAAVSPPRQVDFVIDAVETSGRRQAGEGCLEPQTICSTTTIVPSATPACGGR
jgi:hypothetical protein